MPGCRFICSLVLILSILTAASAQDRKDRHVVLITVDGLAAYLLNDPSAPLPAIRALAASGVAAEGVVVQNPSVTWPNHTTLVTGVRPELHGVLFNGVLDRTGPGLPVKVDGRKDRKDLVRVPTLFDVLHQRGLTASAINWPCTRNSQTLVDDFPDVPDMLQHTTPRLLDELDEAKILPKAEHANFGKLSGPARDRIWTRAACHVIARRMPNLLLMHLLNVDSIHHRYGPQTPAGYSAVAYADACVQELVDAVTAAGLKDQTTFIVTADHGFITIPRTIQPNVVLRKAGLLTVEGTQVTAARAHAVPEGGIAMLYLTVREQAEEDRKKVLELFREHEGIAGIVQPDEFSKYGLPQPDEYPQMADLILVAKDGYGFNATATGDSGVIESTTTLGTHGFLSTNPRMNAVLVLSGAGITSGKPLGVVESIDVAPTAARLLGVEVPGAQGKPLQEALTGR